MLESAYEKASAIVPEGKGLLVQSRHPIHVNFRPRMVGEFCVDLFVEGKAIVAFKTAKAIAPEHQPQFFNDLKATGIEVGLLIDFGNPKLKYKRFARHK